MKLLIEVDIKRKTKKKRSNTTVKKLKFINASNSWKKILTVRKLCLQEQSAADLTNLPN